MASLLELARQVHQEERGDLPDDPQERADAIARELNTLRPGTTARSRQRAAAEAVGVAPPPSPGKVRDELDRPRRRRRRQRAKKVTGRARRLARRQVRRTGAGALVVQALGLVALYWLLRHAQVVEAVSRGVVAVIRWVREPVPFPGGS